MGPIMLSPSDGPLYRQLYERLRQQILDGGLPSGSRLPPSRELAKQLGVSRNTVVLAFEQLQSEGFIESRVGDGSYVATLHMHKPVLAQPQTVPRQLSQRGVVLANTLVTVPRKHREVAFRLGAPDYSLFPYAAWIALERQHWQDPSGELLGYSHPAGYAPLRQAIATYLHTARGVRCLPEQVIVTSGSQQGLDLAARVLLDPGQAAWIEDPGYLGARAALKAAGVQTVPVPVDLEGLQIEVGQQLAPHAKLVYVTPSHQFPLGHTLSLSRRLQLLRWAAQQGVWIVEDDYDSEYRYEGKPLASLQGLDDHQRVIYLGTFSKVLLPGLRLGYMVVPPDLVDAFTAAKALLDRHPPGLAQGALSSFIHKGYFARHIRRTRQVYGRRRNLLHQALQQTFGSQLRLSHNPAGMHLVLYLPLELNDHEVCQKAASHNLEVLPLSAYFQGAAGSHGLLLGYAGVPEKQLLEGVQQLATTLRSWL